MRSLLALLLLVSTVVPAQTSPRPRNRIPQQQSTENKETPPDALSKGSVTIIENHMNAKENECRSGKETTSIYKRAIAPETWPHWALFFAAVLAAIIAVITLIAIKEEAQEIRKVAEAANKNAQGTITAQRAWIQVTPLNWSPELREKWEPGDPQPTVEQMRPTVHLFNAKIRNVGKTNAHVDELAVRYFYIEDSLSRLPDIPDYGTLSPQNGYLLIPNDEYWASARLTTMEVHPVMPQQPKGVESGLLNAKQIKRIKDSSDFLFAYGIVKYRDDFGESRETRFGYVYDFTRWSGIEEVDKPRFKRGGPEKYNCGT